VDEEALEADEVLPEVEAVPQAEEVASQPEAAREGSPREVEVLPGVLLEAGEALAEETVGSEEGGGGGDLSRCARLRGEGRVGRDLIMHFSFSFLRPG
jgi:hypothetical protein